MDALTSKTKELFPDVSDDEAVEMVTAAKKAAPGADEATLISAIQSVKDDGTKSDQARNYVKEKYQLGQQFSPEARQQLIDQNNEEAGGINWRAGLSALGAGLSGKDAASAGQAVLSGQKASRDAKLANFDKARDLAISDKDRAISDEQKLARKDPNSQVSKSLQQMAVEDYGMDAATAAKIPAEILEARLPGLKYKAERADKAKDQDLKQQLADVKTQLAGAKTASDAAKNDTKLSEGQKAVDKDYAKDYNDWTSGGKNQAEASVEKLEGVVARLKKGTGGTGGSLSGLRSNLPGLFQDEDYQKNDSDVRSEALKLIKQNLSGSTSDKDVERVVSTLWNPSDSTENNVARVEDFLGTVKKNMAANDAKAQEYQNSGSLRNFKGAPANADKTVGDFPRKVRKDGKIADVKNQQELDDAIGKGWT